MAPEASTSPAKLGPVKPFGASRVQGPLNIVNITEQQWVNFACFNQVGNPTWNSYYRADPARAARALRALYIERAEAKRSLFSQNLDAANAVAASEGLPLLSEDDALEHYGEGGHGYCPFAPDKGANGAGAGSPSHVARWRICVILHEGPAALIGALREQNEAFDRFVSLLPKIREATQKIAVLTEAYHE